MGRTRGHRQYGPEFKREALSRRIAKTGRPHKGSGINGPAPGVNSGKPMRAMQHRSSMTFPCYKASEFSRRHRRQVVFLAGLCLCAAAAAQNPAPPVVAARAERQAVIEEVPISGTVSSPRVTQLSPEVAGLVNQVLAEAGDRVEAGAVLVRLDRTLAELALEAAEAATEQAQRGTVGRPAPTERCPQPGQVAGHCRDRDPRQGI